MCSGTDVEPNLDSILKELDSRGVVLVAAAHNEYAIKDIGNDKNITSLVTP